MQRDASWPCLQEIRMRVKGFGKGERGESRAVWKLVRMRIKKPACAGFVEVCRISTCSCRA